MVDLREALDDQQDQPPEMLDVCRLGAEPVMLQLFTSEVEEASLHFESDSAVRSYIKCPGEDCPTCYLGSAPQLCFLLPVLNVESRQVEVRRVPPTRGSQALAAGLLPILRNKDLPDKIVHMRRDGYRYTVWSKPMQGS